MGMNIDDRVIALMALVDEYADAFHNACRPDGGIQFADGFVAKMKKDELRAALGAALAAPAEPVAWGQLGTLNGKTYLRMNYNRTPYPPPADVARNLNLVPLYTEAPAVPQTDAKGDPTYCERHKPNGGAYGGCLVCAGEKLQHALSRISYACSEPNEMEVSPYDVNFDEEAVVKQVIDKLAKRD